MQNTHERDLISDSSQVNRGYTLREDLRGDYKRIALEEEQKLYKVREEAPYRTQQRKEKA